MPSRVSSFSACETSGDILWHSLSIEEAPRSRIRRLKDSCGASKEVGCLFEAEEPSKVMVNNEELVCVLLQEKDSFCSVYWREVASSSECAGKLTSSVPLIELAH
jgi:uncharacterized cysteine cluster protein YcgN (CxxCxxCC family)